MVDDMGWWAVPIVSLVIFTLYGIEGIGSQLEDPFGYDRNDIKMDAIVEDEKVEIEAILNEWRRFTQRREEVMELEINRAVANGNGNGCSSNGIMNDNGSGNANGNGNGCPSNGAMNGNGTRVTNGYLRKARSEMFLR